MYSHVLVYTHRDVPSSVSGSGSGSAVAIAVVVACAQDASRA